MIGHSLGRTETCIGPSTMIGHSLGRMETCFGQSTQGAGIRYQNTFQMQILLVKGLDAKKMKDCRGKQAILTKRGVLLECEIDWPCGVKGN